jgi:hypothetical protein
MPNQPRTLRRVHFTINTATARITTAKFDGIDHLVVPVVMLVGNRVISPMGSSGPEFVPAEIMELGVGSWNGRPIVTDHPSDEAGAISANLPAVLESLAFGRLFNARFENNSLKADAYLDPARAARVGTDAMSVITRCQSGDSTVEVSIGAWTVLEEVSGRYDGVDYQYRWSTCVVPDHLAMLPEGVKGACSAEMGCGAPRVNKQQETSDMSATTPTTLTGFQRALQVVAGALGIRTAAGDTSGTSDAQLRNDLWESLRATVPGFDYVVEVYPDTSTVVYCARPKDEYIYFQRTYTRPESGGQVALTDDDIEVMSKMTWVPVTKSDDTATENASAALKAACSCPPGGDGNNAIASDVQVAPVATTVTPPIGGEKGTAMPADNAVTALVGKLITDSKSPFEESDRAHLESLSVEKLTALSAVLTDEDDDEEANVPPAAVTPPATPPAQIAAVPITEEQLPVELRRQLTRARQMEAHARKQHMAALAGAVKSGIFTQAALDAKDIDELAALVKLSGVNAPKVDYSLVGVPVDPDVTPVPPAPDVWDIAGLQARAKAGANGRR